MPTPFNELSIGLEYECYRRERDIRFFHLRPDTITPVADVPGLSIGIDTEYYNEIEEVTFVGKAQHFAVMRDMATRDLHIREKYSKGFPFIGTHVHFFDQELFDSYRPGWKKSLLIYSYFLKAFLQSNCYHGLDAGEFLRMIAGYHFLGRINVQSQNSIDYILRKKINTELKMRDRQFSPKYDAVYPSPSRRSGKPASIEVRCIPNSLFLLAPQKFAATVEKTYTTLCTRTRVMDQALDRCFDLYINAVEVFASTYPNISFDPPQDDHDEIPQVLRNHSRLRDPETGARELPRPVEPAQASPYTPAPREDNVFGGLSDRSLRLADSIAPPSYIGRSVRGESPTARPLGQARRSSQFLPQDINPWYPDPSVRIPEPDPAN